jgi:hypothetical protein
VYNSIPSFTLYYINVIARCHRNDLLAFWHECRRRISGDIFCWSGSRDISHVFYFIVCMCIVYYTVFLLLGRRSNPSTCWLPHVAWKLLTICATRTTKTTIYAYKLCILYIIIYDIHIVQHPSIMDRYLYNINIRGGTSF